MKLAFSMRYLSKSMGYERASAALASAGIKLLNYTPWHAAEFNAAMKAFDKYGLNVYQTHGPDCRYNNLDDEQHAKNMFACLMTSARMGAKYMIVHGNVFDYVNLTYTPEAALRYNHDFFAPIVEMAEQLNVKIAFENTFADVLERKQNKPHFCAAAEELAALVDSFDSPCACACWDTGHGAIANKENQPKAIKSMGKRIECTHIHDNDLIHDQHSTPYEGSIDWNACMGALKTYGNADVLCYEHVYGEIPEDEVDTYAAALYEIGMKLSDL